MKRIRDPIYERSARTEYALHCRDREQRSGDLRVPEGGISERVAQKRGELIRVGVREEYIEDFDYDAEHSTGPICGSQERIEAYLTILEVLSE